jgi:ArsR family transcriptional regulator
MSTVDVTLARKRKRAAGEPRTVAPARPRVDADHAGRLARYAKALGDPIRVQLVDVLAAHPGELCACELLPLFDVAQSTLAHHLKTLADAGILEGRRQGLFVHYLVRPEALGELSGWRAAPPGAPATTPAPASAIAH